LPAHEKFTTDHQDKVKLQLHKEELEVSKMWVETADVKVYKSTYTEEKLIAVLITHEELVIEKKRLLTDGIMDEKTEIIRIPFSEERIKVTKQPVFLENVEIYKKQFEEIIHINKTLKEEKARIKTIGDLKVVDNE
jgi:uncharacterized protein (TIGR02271 family)